MLSDIVELTDHELDQLLDALSQGTIAAGASLQQIRKAGLDSRAEQIRDWLAEAVGPFGSVAVSVIAVPVLKGTFTLCELSNGAPTATVSVTVAAALVLLMVFVTVN